MYVFVCVSVCVCVYVHVRVSVCMRVCDMHVIWKIKFGNGLVHCHYITT